MWGYQSHFQSKAQRFAESVFNKLDKNLKPNVFLVGILVEEKDNSYPVCVEPEECGYDPSIFSNVQEEARKLAANDEDRDIVHTHAEVAKQELKKIELRALKNAILGIIKNRDKISNLTSFCSFPVLVEGYRVSVVIQFNEQAFSSHYYLSRDKAVNGIFTIYKSLLDSTINKYFNECLEILSQPAPGKGFDIFDRKVDELIKSAGESFMYTPAYAANLSCETLYTLFESCNIISSMRYEGEEGIGRILIAKPNHPSIEMIITLESPIHIQDYRAVRKLLEMSSLDINLVSDSNYFYGLGKLVNNYNTQEENLFIINFTNHYGWEFLHDGNLMMRVVYGQPELPTTLIDEQKFCIDLKRIFGSSKQVMIFVLSLLVQKALYRLVSLLLQDYRFFRTITQQEIEKLLEIVREATKQKHGTIVVVSTGAKEEAERLKNQSTQITPISLNSEIITTISAIDGAILISPDSTCYSIGVILDGLATKKGNRSRGARYNSVIRYIETSEYDCMAIVISEDGSVDLVPDLMPQILRSLITEAIESLHEINNPKTFDDLRFNQAMSLLEKYKFYLLPEMCKEINSFRSEIEKIRDQNREEWGIIKLFQDFYPDEEMDESYFLS